MRKSAGLMPAVNPRSVMPIKKNAGLTPVMMKSLTDFDAEKAIQTILYIASKLGKQAEIYKLLKVVYFADKRHLRRYGRFIFGDSYVALNYGPVPSKAYDIVKYVRDGATWCGVFPKAKESFSVKGRTIVPSLKPDLDIFSHSDIECLNETIEECRNLTFEALKRRSHDQAFRRADADGDISIEVIASTFPEKNNLLEYLRDPCPG